MKSTNEPSALRLPSFAVPEGAASLFGIALRLQAESARAMLRYQTEAIAFVGRRAQEDMKLVTDLATSAAFNDAFDVLSEFYENALAEYAREASRFAALGSKAAAQAAREVRTEAETTITDMAARTAA